MNEVSKADRFLVERIQQGDSDAWTQLVDRYRGRLLAFAARRVRRRADAEDLLQEAFICFLRALPKFRGDSALETFLFTILRRRIIDHYRGRKSHVCLLQDVLAGEDDSDEPLGQLPSDEPSASWYARRDERRDRLGAALADAIREVVNAHKRSLNFRDLKIVEALFYAQLPNNKVAELVGIDAGQVGLIKHRTLKRIRGRVSAHLPAETAEGSADEDSSHALLTEVWEDLRISCPKRNTIGAFLLDTLDELWRDYVAFHLDTLGCRFCLANREDLEARTRDEAPATRSVRRRILDSTVGFLRQSYLGDDSK